MSLSSADIKFRRAEQADDDAREARDLVSEALDKNSQGYRFMGCERLLAAAQVYATLATRRY